MYSVMSMEISKNVVIFPPARCSVLEKKSALFVLRLIRVFVFPEQIIFVSALKGVHAMPGISEIWKRKVSPPPTHTHYGSMLLVVEGFQLTWVLHTWPKHRNTKYIDCNFSNKERKNGQMENWTTHVVKKLTRAAAAAVTTWGEQHFGIMHFFVLLLAGWGRQHLPSIFPVWPQFF